MGTVTGSYLIARTLKEEGVEVLFYLMGGPNFDLVMAAQDLDIKTVDFRHEQAAAFAAHAYARVTGKPGVCTAASVLGGMGGYGIGFFLFDQIGQPILDFYHYADEFQSFRAKYNDWGGWAVFIFGLTFLPYKVITIFSGVTGLEIWSFTLASVLARGMRFFVVAWLLWKFGAPIRSFIEARLGQLFVLFTVLVIAGLVVVKLLV